MQQHGWALRAGSVLVLLLRSSVVMLAQDLVMFEMPLVAAVAARVVVKCHHRCCRRPCCPSPRFRCLLRRTVVRTFPSGCRFTYLANIVLCVCCRLSLLLSLLLLLLSLVSLLLLLSTAMPPKASHISRTTYMTKCSYSG